MKGKLNFKVDSSKGVLLGTKCIKEGIAKIRLMI